MAPRASSSPPRIAVVDYGAGNLVSIDQALTTVGAEVRIARGPEGFEGVDAVIVPGVGAARPAMRRLARAGLLEPIRSWLAADRPYLGICLGLQLLYETSDEDAVRMLGVLPGRVQVLRDAPTLPHIGWNQVELRCPHPLFAGIASGTDLYFVHSYAAVPASNADDGVLAETRHGAPFVSAVARGRTLGVQFHPERSGTDGLRLLANFAALAGAG
jgi:imidazole glycerol phosphate synthase glutamine amidotransferase subunit